MYALSFGILINTTICGLFSCIAWITILISGIPAINHKTVEKQNRKLDSSAFAVKYNSLVLGATIFLVALFIISALLFPVLYLCDIPDGLSLNITVMESCIFGAGAVASVVIVVLSVRRKVYVSDAGIKFAPMFGKRREYDWEDIAEVRTVVFSGRTNYYIYVKPDNKKAFFINEFMVGGGLFLDKLREHGFMF